MANIRDIFIFSDVLDLIDIPVTNTGDIESNLITVSELIEPVNITFTDGILVVNGVSVDGSVIINNNDTLKLIVNNVPTNVINTYIIQISDTDIKWNVGVFNIPDTNVSPVGNLFSAIKKSKIVDTNPSSELIQTLIKLLSTSSDDISSDELIQILEISNIDKGELLSILEFSGIDNKDLLSIL